MCISIYQVRQLDKRLVTTLYLNFRKGVREEIQLSQFRLSIHLIWFMHAAHYILGKTKEMMVHHLDKAKSDVIMNRRNAKPS